DRGRQLPARLLPGGGHPEGGGRRRPVLRQRGDGPAVGPDPRDGVPAAGGRERGGAARGRGIPAGAGSRPTRADGVHPVEPADRTAGGVPGHRGAGGAERPARPLSRADPSGHHGGAAAVRQVFRTGGGGTTVPGPVRDRGLAGGVVMATAERAQLYE